MHSCFCRPALTYDSLSLHCCLKKGQTFAKRQWVAVAKSDRKETLYLIWKNLGFSISEVWGGLCCLDLQLVSHLRMICSISHAVCLFVVSLWYSWEPREGTADRALNYTLQFLSPFFAYSLVKMIKGMLEYSVFIYSPSCGSKPVWLKNIYTMEVNGA